MIFSVPSPLVLKRSAAKLRLVTEAPWSLYIGEWPSSQILAEFSHRRPSVANQVKRRLCVQQVGTGAQVARIKKLEVILNEKREWRCPKSQCRIHRSSEVGFAFPPMQRHLATVAQGLQFVSHPLRTRIVLRFRRASKDKLMPACRQLLEDGLEAVLRVSESGRVIGPANERHVNLAHGKTPSATVLLVSGEYRYF